MSIELATTQPVRQPGTPPPPGAPQADQLGLTLRERMWLARAALGTIVLSLGASLVLLSLIPGEPSRAAGPMQAELAERALRPAPVELAPLVIAPLPAAQAQRAFEPEPEPETFEPEPETFEPEPPAPLISQEPTAAVSSSRPARRVMISRNRVSPYILPAAPAVDLSKPQSLAPTRAEPKPEPEPEPISEPLAKPTQELKRPSFE